MELKQNGKVIKGIGGLYVIRLSDGGVQLREHGIEPDDRDRIYCKARGVFRHERTTLLTGDEVILRVDTETASKTGEKKGDAHAGILIDEIRPRKNELVRPPMANLDCLFVVFAARNPEPALDTVDKLITIAEHTEIEPVIVVTKSDLDPEAAEKYADIYRRCGFTVFLTGNGYDSEALTGYLEKFARDGRTAAFAGASGVGKSTLMNRLFPSLRLSVGEVSEKTRHGRHTTRQIELFPLSEQFGQSGEYAGYLADTPGFGMLDFVEFDYYGKEDLPYVFREFAPYIGKCRYTKCTHTKEEGCAVLEAVRDGSIPAERHGSYLLLYNTLKNKHEWKK